MPNWCYNSATFRHDSKEVIDAFEAELKKEDAQPLNYLRPNPSGEWEYDWSVSNWGTKWDVSPQDWEREDDNTIVMHFDSAWSPPTTLYEFLTENGWEIRAYYHEPGMGFAGKFEDGFDDYYEFDYTDRESVENLPEDIIDFTNALEDLENYEQEQYQESVEDLERTDWFDVNVTPTVSGRYEVTTEAWPYAQFCEWTGEKWQRWEGDDIQVNKWRGLTQDPDNWDPVAELDKIVAPE